MDLIIIAAIGKNNELGKDNSLIWKLPHDLQFFKEKTTGHTIVMGRKTFESLGRVLPNRTNIVLSRNKKDFESNVVVFESVEDFIKNYNTEDEVFIIGGASIYKQFINHVKKMYLTEVNASCENADVYFPEFNKEEWKKEVLKENSDNGITYTHVMYIRK